MCDCDFSTKEYLDAVVILHPIGPDSLMVLLGDYTYVDSREENHLVLGNLRHGNKVATDEQSMFEIADNEQVVIELPCLPILSYLVDHPEDVVVITGNLEERSLNWRSVKRSEKESI